MNTIDGLVTCQNLLGQNLLGQNLLHYFYTKTHEPN